MPHRNMPVKNEYSQNGIGIVHGLEQLGRMKNLKAIRTEKNISQALLAEMADVTQGTISKMEAGGMNVTLDKIQRVADALGVTPVELFGLEETQQRVLRALSRMEPDDRGSALAVLEAMAKKNNHPQ